MYWIHVVLEIRFSHRNEASYRKFHRSAVDAYVIRVRHGKWPTTRWNLIARSACVVSQIKV